MELLKKVYPQVELDRIKALEAKNDKMEGFFDKSRDKMSKELEPILEVLYESNFKTNNSKKIIDAQAVGLKLRQDVNSYIGKVIRQQKFLLYSTNFGLKTNLGEKKLLIEAHLRENDRYCNLLETHIEFLRNTLDTLESYQYAIKNVIALMDYLGAK
jgi:hypothetical protein